MLFCNLKLKNVSLPVWKPYKSSILNTGDIFFINNKFKNKKYT